VRSLAGERLVALQPGSGFRRHMEAAFATAGMTFRPAVEVGNLSLVRRFVAAGLGVAPVPGVAFSSRDRFQGVRAMNLIGAPRVTYYLAHRSGAPLSDAARLLISLL
jgi:DNA-binding transcriptional LysR family regulator